METPAGVDIDCIDGSDVCGHRRADLVSDCVRLALSDFNPRIIAIHLAANRGHVETQPYFQPALLSFAPESRLTPCSVFRQTNSTSSVHSV